MSLHDWSTVPAGVFHAFHLAWIGEIQRALNSGVLPPDYYALAEQHALNYEPDVLALERRFGLDDRDDAERPGTTASSTLLLAEPKTTWTGSSEMAYYRRKKNSISIRHVSGDDVVAMIEIVSPGNKDGFKATKSFVEKACALIQHDIHLLIVDVLPHGKFDPDGLHAEIWEAIDGTRPQDLDQPIVFSSYEASGGVRAFAEALGVGAELPEMPLFLLPGQHVLVPLESTYRRALEGMPWPWRKAIGAP